MKINNNIEKLNQTDDLSYLASVAFETFQVSDLEIDFLKTKIDKKVGFSGGQFSAIFISVLTGLFIGISVFFVIFQRQKNHPSINNLNEISQNDKSLNNLILKTDTVFLVNETEKVVDVKEHFTSIANNQAESVLVESPEHIEPKTLLLDDSKMTENNDIIFEFIPNAPVVFISNLKVTNYRSYYFKHNEVVDLSVNTGLSAQYENNSKIEKTNLSKSNAYLAHKIIQNAMWLFSTKKIANCIEELTLLYNFNNNDANAQFYLGMANYQLGKYNYAINFFKKNLDNENNIFHQESDFYLALCYINGGEKEKGTILLNSIIENKGFYCQRAKETLLNLNNK
jgi:tetratricopeptide (TPR) repeat protein